MRLNPPYFLGGAILLHEIRNFNLDFLPNFNAIAIFQKSDNIQYNFNQHWYDQLLWRTHLSVEKELITYHCPKAIVVIFYKNRSWVSEYGWFNSQQPNFRYTKSDEWIRQCFYRFLCFFAIPSKKTLLAASGKPSVRLLISCQWFYVQNWYNVIIMNYF